MKVTLKQWTAVAFVCLLASCGNNYRSNLSEKSTDAATMEDTSNAVANSSDSTVENAINQTQKEKPLERKFVRTADLKFKVKNVQEATTQIENITKQFGGFVTYSNLNSNIENIETTAISEDSSLETKHFLAGSDISIRVPNAMLDTTLRSIATLIQFLDNRSIKADNVALTLIANKLAIARNTTDQNRLVNAIDKNNKNLDKTTNAIDRASEHEAAADNARVNNLSLYDQIDYSTINLNIYQREAVQREVIANDKNTNAYSPNLGKRILAATHTGWIILEDMIVFLFQLWTLILFGIILYFLLKRYLFIPNKKLDNEPVK